MNNLQKWMLEQLCEKHELDEQLIDLSLTYDENKDLLQQYLTPLEKSEIWLKQYLPDLEDSPITAKKFSLSYWVQLQGYLGNTKDREK